MEKLYLLFVFTFITLQVYSQELVIQKNDGSILSIELNTIDNITFRKPCPGLASIDYAGKTYNTILIGYQCWLKENLDVGTMVNQSAQQTNNSIIEKYCYDNDPFNCNNYGGLYQWDETMQYTTEIRTQGICPSGWHIPALSEYQQLITFVEGEANALKEVGQGTGDGAGTNTSGFSALLAGANLSIYFSDLDVYAYFWSSSMVTQPDAYGLTLYYAENNIFSSSTDKQFGFSVRCIKD